MKLYSYCVLTRRNTSSKIKEIRLYENFNLVDLVLYEQSAGKFLDSINEAMYTQVLQTFYPLTEKQKYKFECFFLKEIL